MSQQKEVIIEPNYYTTKFFTEYLYKPVYLPRSILELSKMYEFWYIYVKPKYSENPKLWYMDTDSFIVYKKADDIYKDIAENIETRFDTSNYELGRPLPKRKDNKVIGLMKDELGGKITKNHKKHKKVCHLENLNLKIIKTF